MNRRSFVKTLGVAGSTVLASDRLLAENTSDESGLVGVLVDTTLCAGCRSCEVACAEANNLPEPDLDDQTVFDLQRKQSESRRLVVNRYTEDESEVYVRTQCMHCVQPACASACLTKAMEKTDEGPVIWNESKCMGCRFCMISCPFDIPKFEYNSAVPKIEKCNLCWSRLKEGEKPACVEACPAEAVLFGKRDELLEEARRRIYTDPDSYVPHIYGEHEAGGTGFLYLSPVPFDKLGFKTNLEKSSYPELAKDFLYAVPVILVLWPAFLAGLNKATKREEEDGSNGQWE